MRKFLQADHEDIEYIAKLNEELGEVAVELLKSERGLLQNTQSLEDELKHLSAVAMQWRSQLRRERDSDA